MSLGVFRGCLNETDVNKGEYSRDISINSWRLVYESALTSRGWKSYMFVDQCPAITAVGVLALYATFLYVTYIITWQIGGLRGTLWK